MLVETLIKLLVAEHKKSPITGNILTLGKQTVGTPLSKILQIFHEQDCDINPTFNLEDVKFDQSTRIRSDHSIDDLDFFRLFGDVNYQTMDVSKYEQASILHNLNEPIPPELQGQFDFIIDGGTFDHLFDIKTAFSNVVQLLKPGGRVFQWNAASNYGNAGYISFSADFFYDYYALNRFADCRTYFAQNNDIGGENWYLSEFIPPGGPYGHFKPSYFYVMVIVMAKKGIHSTYDRMPIQLQYRDEVLKEEYKRNIEEFESRKGTSLTPKPIKLSQVKIPLQYKLIHAWEPKSDPHVYKPIGWL